MIEASRQSAERALVSDLRGYFEDLTAELSGAFRSAVRSPRWPVAADVLVYTAATRANPDPLVVNTLIDWGTWKNRLSDRVRPQLLDVVEAGFETGLLRLDVEGRDFTSDDPAVRQTIDELIQKTRGTTDTLNRDMARAIQTGLSEGEDVDEIIGRVEQLLDDARAWRARRIARTNGTAGFERGQLQAFRDAGVKRRSWLTQRDDRVRDGDPPPWDHRAADGQTVRIDEPFLVSGEPLMFPADPAGSAGNVVNCRCSQRARFDNLPATTSLSAAGFSRLGFGLAGFSVST
jgi:hypothetical protein